MRAKVSMRKPVEVEVESTTANAPLEVEGARRVDAACESRERRCQRATGFLARLFGAISLQAPYEAGERIEVVDAPERAIESPALRAVAA
jgi:hypothetical protein